MLSSVGLAKVAACTYGFRAPRFFGKPLLADRLATRLHYRLQALADAELPLVRTGGFSYVVLAQKVGIGRMTGSAMGAGPEPGHEKPGTPCRAPTSRSRIGHHSLNSSATSVLSSVNYEAIGAEWSRSSADMYQTSRVGHPGSVSFAGRK
jgi:hypothetical protein